MDRQAGLFVQRDRSRHDYTVACICPMGVELIPVEAMLDEIHAGLPVTRDSNSYTLGKLGVHNVVVVVLPRTGNNIAGKVATQLLNDFPCVRFGVLVGIGGGVPGSKDIRLGDVVVSQPQENFGGVVQYDMGKRNANGAFERTGMLNRPPDMLVASVERLKSRHRREGNRIAQHITKMLSSNPLMQVDSGYVSPGVAHDQLFKATYVHQGGENCRSCDRSWVEKRITRPDNSPKVFYGTIGSANQVVKDAEVRDELGRDLNIICVDMEAAGVLDALPCIVIRGICDYADSHKNKQWQPYAAAAAAACLKELLDVVPPLEMESINALRIINKVDANEHVTTPQQDPIDDDQNSQDIVDRLRFEHMGSRGSNIAPALSETCQWLFSTPEYRDWINVSEGDGHNAFLWIKSKPAAGKSTMMKFIIKESHRRKQFDIIISFFFNARGVALEKSVEGLFRSLLLQLMKCVPEVKALMEDYYAFTASQQWSSPEIMEGWTLSELQELFSDAIKRCKHKFLAIFIDALDECDEDQVREMIVCLEGLSEESSSAGVRLTVCFSSRHYPQISHRRGFEIVLESQDGHRRDLQLYVDRHLKPGRGSQMEAIRDEVIERASGVFLWVTIVVKILNKAYDQGRMHLLRQRLDELPDDLHNLFQEMLARDTENSPEFILCTQWMLYSKRPLACRELYYAILSGVEPDAVTEWNPEEITNEDMSRYVLNCSKGFAEVISSPYAEGNVQFIHQSVREFFLKDENLAHVDQHLMGNVAGKAHNKLRLCCQRYLIISGQRIGNKHKIAYRLGGHRGTVMQQQMAQFFPFIIYALCHLFHHADAAILSDAFYGPLDMSARSHWSAWNRFFLTYLGFQHDGQFSPVTYMCNSENQRRESLPVAMALDLGHLAIEGFEQGAQSF